jgi:SAM-dependent methyltransferase
VEEALVRRLTGILKVLLIAFGAYLGLLLINRIFRRLFPIPVPRALAPFLESPLRGLSLPRRQTLERSGLRPGQTVLELGSGPGFFTLEAARMVGPEGKLYVVDVQPDMIERVREKVRQAGLTNVEVQVADARHLPFANGTFDVAFLVTVLGELPDKGRALRELRRVLKPNGRLSITERMPDPGYPLIEEVVGWAQGVGFEFLEQSGTAFAYTLNFRSLFGP